MTEREPQPQDFGITHREYALYWGSGGKETDAPDRLILIVCVGFALAVFVGSLVVAQNLWSALGIVFLVFIPPFGFFTFGLLVGFTSLVNVPLKRYERKRLLAGPIVSQVEQYEKARADYWKARNEAERLQGEQEQAQRDAERARREAERKRWEEERERLRKQAEYWMNLSGGQFERELATLFKRRGYRVELRGGAGDGGIDILARKGGQTTIIQCKRYKNPAGPAAARELYGSLMASGADRGILACTAGFTKGVEDFVEGLKGKPITLANVWDIIKVAEAVDGNRAEFTPPAPQRASRRRRR